MSSPSVGYVLVVDTLDSKNSAYPPVQNFIDLYEDEIERIMIFGPSEVAVDRDGVKAVTVPRDPPSSALLRALNYVWYQLRLAAALVRVQNRCDTMFFHSGGMVLLLPILACRLIGISTNVFVLGSPSRSYYETHGRGTVSTVMVWLLNGLGWISCRLADRILVLSDGMASPYDGRFSSTRCVSANLNYVDCERFVRGPPIDERPYDVVYVGRFERVKGITKLARALTQLVKHHPGIQVSLVGDGSLRSDVKRILHENGIDDRVDFQGWIDHDEIPAHFANARVLVLPSESEGVPTSMLEAMACGTVPVATPVGGVPDVISDNETGFLLPDNDPETIARVLNHVLSRKDLNAIADRARAYIYQHHSYDVTAAQFHKLLSTDCGDMSCTMASNEH